MAGLHPSLLPLRAEELVAALTEPTPLRALVATLSREFPQLAAAEIETALRTVLEPPDTYQEHAEQLERYLRERPEPAP